MLHPNSVEFNHGKIWYSSCCTSVKILQVSKYNETDNSDNDKLSNYKITYENTKTGVQYENDAWHFQVRYSPEVNNIVDAVNLALSKYFKVQCRVLEFCTTVQNNGHGYLHSSLEFFSKERIDSDKYKGIVSCSEFNKEYKYSVILVKDSKLRKSILKAMLKFN